jgi:hypothetical protein
MDRVKEFARWVIENSAWQCCELDGADVQGKAVELGLIVETKFDPEIHGDAQFGEEPGDRIFVFSDLIALPPRQNPTE